MDSQYSYIVIRSTGNQKSVWRVSKTIVHPHYFRDWRDLLVNQSEQTIDQIMAKARAELSQLHHDIALLKVERSDYIFLKTAVEMEPEDADHVDGIDDAWYDSLAGNRTIEEPDSSVCIEHLQQHQSAAEEDNARISFSSLGAFSLPPERRRFETHIQDNSTPTKASCVVVEYSPAFSR